MKPTIPVLHLDLCEACIKKTNLDQLAPGMCLNQRMKDLIADMLCEDCKKQLVDTFPPCARCGETDHECEAFHVACNVCGSKEHLAHKHGKSDEEDAEQAMADAFKKMLDKNHRRNISNRVTK